MKKLILAFALLGSFAISGGTSLAIAQPPQPPLSSKPTIVSATVDNITIVSATLRGSVNPNNLTTTVWFESSATGNQQLHLQNIGNSNSTIQVTPHTLLGLNQGTKYKFRIVANNAAGTTTGNWIYFTTLGFSTPKPTISSVYVDEIESTSAKLNGSVNPNGLTTQAWFESSTTGDQRLGLQNIGTGVSVVTLTPYQLSGLAPDTNYTFRIVANNSAGTTTGKWVEFSTKKINYSTVPTIVTTTVDDINVDSAMLNGSVNPNGATTDAWFESSATGDQKLGLQNIGSGNTPRTLYPYTLTGLTPDTSYTFRIVASNNLGTTTGSWVEFRTKGNVSIVPKINSISPSSGEQGDTLDIEINGEGFISGSTVHFTGSGITINSTNIDGTTKIKVNISIDSNASVSERGLTVSNNNGASNSVSFDVNEHESGGGGGGGGGGGSNLCSSHSKRYVSVTTLGAENVLGNAATFNSIVNPNRCATTAWFEYGTSSNLSNYIETAHSSLGSSSSSLDFSQRLTNLTPGVTYYFRVVGNNNAGTIKGNILSFTTLLFVDDNIDEEEDDVIYKRIEKVVDDVVETADDYFSRTRDLTANALFGFTNFLPKTMLGWMILLVLVFIILIISKKIYADYRQRKYYKERVDANHIENLPT